MLYSHLYNNTSNDSSTPLIVYLHGLLGCSDDWKSCTQWLPEYTSLCIDLPGHGMSNLMHCRDFKTCCDQISDVLLTQFPHQPPIVLVGYSMGARIAMVGLTQQHFSALNIQMLISEGGHFGLCSDAEKTARLRHDSRWAERLHHEPIEQVLGDWYQQPVFSSLNHEQRQTLIHKRSANLGPSVGKMLMATSLAKQNYLLESLTGLSIPVHYICGEKDSKFSHLAELSGLSYSQVKRAGHNVHIEQPEAFADIVKSQIRAFL
ncbi:2-succinyl-6-hydroxy-2,4-cyclohexadiene-1-carboxylate synthase [Vibrio neptunius]|uniref:2-succinyl-6-hydroxy-2, 4-cyclohexadiene-1-carboxylate synthase n=1 Tax=Vibrio neptunius TaxID=170651 RepID=UPI0019CFD62A|nr:2-succinyl-6-hydroxy-2,4-cyclohexadiene-1-carboxylate synthase [Vibrio neptunius]MBN3573275.1 2-succinyl-6-hydroxy-2,4-cyclohexadiene-1-carboxylate synthase [Vibrio neptunius]QXX06104.1 2-succinyl-6-hydroxy-2,4-cyclohexadiene-1-carboxylate synthase [Vibrio neptunius]